MANQIAGQFTYLSHDDAVDAVAGHIRKFWDPRMRRQLLAQADEDTGVFEPIVIDAINRLRDSKPVG